MLFTLFLSPEAWAVNATCIESDAPRSRFAHTIPDSKPGTFSYPG